MKFDIQGRINNMRLPDGKVGILYSIYEAVSNSIHAINDRFGPQSAAEGRVCVQVETNDDGEVESLEISDNGEGFTPDNVSSFETSDSMHKYARGGKGVGRFVWIKMFEDIRINSTYLHGKSAKTVTFRFMPEKPNSIAYRKLKPGKVTDLGTIVSLDNLRRELPGRIRTDTFLKDLSVHFFPQFIDGTLPKITICKGDDEDSLHEYIADRIKSRTSSEVEIILDGKKVAVTVDHVLADKKISSSLRNSYILTGHGRSVGDPISIEQKYGLSTLPDSNAYIAVVRSSILDATVNQERLGFNLADSQRGALENALFAEIEKFLSEHISNLRSTQKRKVESVLFEHPQLASQIVSLDDYVTNLYPGMNEEQIGQNLFVLLFRDEKEIRKTINRLSHLDTLDEEMRDKAAEVLVELENQEKHRLAELVVKRHQVLELANIMLKYSDASSERYVQEKVIHDLICPMREMYGAGDYHKHNLWILDDRYGSYEFFASDKSISSISTGASTKEPDLIFFNALGFRREGTTEPIAIVEFKRPGDERLSQNPLSQVLGYIDELRGSSVRGVDGDVIADIGPDTNFDCVIICELTEPARKLFRGSIAQHQTPDGEGLYGYSPEHRAFIRVVSFRKMLRDAEMRHQAFFAQLKLGSPSLAAKSRAARARSKKAIKINLAAIPDPAA